MEVLRSGEGEVKVTDLDRLRESNRKKNRSLVNKLMTEKEAVRKFVDDGDYIAWDFCTVTRGPVSLVREIIRQRKKRLWGCAKFTYYFPLLLSAAGCMDKVDIGFMIIGNSFFNELQQEKIKFTEWSNETLALRIAAGAMGVPFVPVSSFMGSDGFKYSGAKMAKDPFTGRTVCLVPALNPDIALIHVHQADVYGNARVFGPSAAPLETAMASRKVIVSTEQIIDTEEFRKSPALTTIPCHHVDAVVQALFGAYPGTVPGFYRHDSDAIMEINKASAANQMGDYLEEAVYSVASHQEFLEKRVGLQKLIDLKAKETIKEGYYS